VGSTHAAAGEANVNALASSSVAQYTGTRKTAARAGTWAERTALVILLPPALALLILGIWLPGQMQNWLHLIGMALK
jgi:hypothetical protein